MTYTHLDECPKCGGGLVRRVSRNGWSPGKAFLGCASWPHCDGARPYPDRTTREIARQDQFVRDCYQDPDRILWLELPAGVVA